MFKQLILIFCFVGFGCATTRAMENPTLIPTEASVVEASGFSDEDLQTLISNTLIDVPKAEELVVDFRSVQGQACLSMDDARKLDAFLATQYEITEIQLTYAVQTLGNRCRSRLQEANNLLLFSTNNCNNELLMLRRRLEIAEDNEATLPGYVWFGLGSGTGVLATLIVVLAIVLAL